MIPVAILSVAAFVAAFQCLGIVPRARQAIAVSRRTTAIIADAGLDDDAKEAAVRQASAALLMAFAHLALRGAGAVLAAWVPIQLADWAGLVPAGAVVDFLLRPAVIVIASILVILGLWLGGRLWRS